MPQSVEPVAVVGVSAIMPGAVDVQAFWRAVVEGRDLMGDVPPDRWLIEDHFHPDPAAPDKTYARRGAFLPEIEIDPMALGIPPVALAGTDTAQLLALVAADRLLKGARFLERADRERAGVFIGCAALQLPTEMGARSFRPTWRRALLDSGLAEPEAEAVCERIAQYLLPWQTETFPGMLGNVVAGRIAKRFNLHGTSFTVDAACASSLAALSAAVDDLRLGRSDLAITGGVDTLTDPVTFVCFSKTPALSPTGDCRPFDEAADGTMLGEGVALFALKRMSDAERDGDDVHAVIRGIGSSTDGNDVSVFAPSQRGQERALRRAYAAAGYGPRTVGLVEAHGTGTPIGDSVEAAALRAVFTDPDAGGEESARAWCALGSVKSQIGHAKAASGAAGLLKATLALNHRVLPPTIKVQRPDPRLELDGSPFYLNTATRPWVHTADHPRRAGVSAFGFGGANFHVALEEYRPADEGSARLAPRLPVRGTELVPLSGDTPQSLVTRCRELAAAGSPDGLAVAARRAQRDFRATDGARLCVVAGDSAELARKLEQAAERITAEPALPFSLPAGLHYGPGRPDAGRIAFLFPGQGSQRVGMGADVAAHFPQARAVWDRVGADGLAEVVFPPPAFTDEERAAQTARLADTRWAQPAIAAHSLMLLNLLDAAGVRPDCVAGHSFGELVALHAARALDERTVMRIARGRGKLVHELTRTAGSMLALAAPPEEVRPLLLDERGEAQAWIAVHNTPRQVVVAAADEAIDAVSARAARSGVAAKYLNTGVAFHSPLVSSVPEPLLAFLSEHTVRAPLLDVYGNTDAARYPIEPEQVRRTLSAQVAEPVRFCEMVERMYADGVRTFVEVGPGNTLTGFVRQILGGRPHRAVAVDRTGQHGVRNLHNALAELAALGVPIAFDALWADHVEPASAPAAKPLAPVVITSANHGRRYPPNQRFPLPAPRAVLATAANSPTVQAPAPQPDDRLAHAIVESQRQTARAHEAYLNATQKSIEALLSLATTGQVPPAGPPPPTARPAWDAPGPAPSDAVLPRARTETPALPAPAAEPPPAAVPDSPSDLESLVLSVVAEKTGYPPELLAPHMELEADLGLDSITRTQIFAALRPSFPHLEDLSPAMVGPLLTSRTVSEIAQQLHALATTAPVPVRPALPVADRPRRRLLQLEARPAVGEPMPGLGHGPLLVTPDGTGVAEEVVRLLRKHGVTAEPGTTVPADARGVLFLGGLADLTGPRDALAVQHDAFRLAQQAAPLLRTGGGVFVTVQDTGGGFGHTHPDPVHSWLGGLAALARTAGREWPATAVKAIDCRRGRRTPHEVAGAIVDELLSGGAEMNIALDEDGTRRTVTLAEPTARPTAPPVLDDSSVIVVTGGARGITHEALLALAERHPARFALLGRTPAGDGPGGVAAALAALRRTGAQVRYAALDIRDERALRNELDHVREEWGPITGIVHGAGVLADGRIEDKSPDQFTRVFDTKVGGLHALLSETRQDPLRLICAFSSIVGFTGNSGQCDYAMANETLNQVLAAEQAARPDARVRALLWGPWRGGMVTPELRDLFGLAGIETIPVDEGARAFVDELGFPADDPRVVITAGAAAALLAEVPLVSR
ncbi:type I polyketide synthase [Streptomyces sp. NBC_00091]|uniref:type I polyketide synthase n=1 Tax=Streptomyces sp. NBC_00091 TaxID=2975648 RepID=UPI002253CCC2|nr:type I polyketide synthase [Streptomyces sp. NBC_00091]